MLTRIGAAARRSDLTIQQFQDHWRTQHGPTAGSIPFLERYVQHHAVLVDGRTLLPYPGFDACSELDFESPEAMDEGFRQAAERGELKADEDRFVDKTRYSWLLGESETRMAALQRVGSAPGDPVTLVTWWRTHPTSTKQRLVDVLTGEWEDGIDSDPTVPVVDRRLVVARDDWHEGRGAPTADAVEIITFGGLDVALSFLAGHAQRQAPALAGVAFGVERHLARPVEVVLPPSG